MAAKPKRKFRAHGLTVIAEPIHTKVKGGTKISLGFPVLKIGEHIDGGEKFAKALAKVMTASPHFR